MGKASKVTFVRVHYRSVEMKVRLVWRVARLQNRHYKKPLAIEPTSPRGRMLNVP
jgi:hypothetical protein